MVAFNDILLEENCKKSQLLFDVPEMLSEPDANNNLAQSLPSIKSFYSNATVFVTGGTGFLGKVLIEKLLRTCEDIGTIYVLIRSKKGLTTQQRYEQFISNRVFDRVRKMNTAALEEKLTLVSGDITEPYLGLQDCDYQKMCDSVNIVFNVAATVRFTEKITTAAISNTLSARQMIMMAMKMPGLKGFVHVSTAYSNPFRHDVAEEVYPSEPIDVDLFLKLLDMLPAEMVDSMERQLCGPHPNTYTFTKSMAEQLMAKHSSILPICIVRPSIVTAAVEDPYVGWLDNVGGVTGIMTEIGRGTISSIVAEGQGTIDLIPVDMAVNTMITAAWALGLNKSRSTTVYNCTSGQINPIKWNRLGDLTVQFSRQYPSKYVVLYPGFSYRRSLFVHKIVEIFYHFVPAIIYDQILRLAGCKPIMLKTARKTQQAAENGRFFGMHEWIFKSDMIRHLVRNVAMASDGDQFNCDISKIDWNEYIENYILGIRKYILCDNMETLPNSQRRVKMFLWIRHIFHLSLFVLFCCLLVKLLL